MMDLASVRAIYLHTHAEEHCGCHADDGYDDLQSAMAGCFRAPWKHPSTIAETAAHYRTRNTAAVFFPVDAGRETGYHRYRNEEVAEATAEHSDCASAPRLRMRVRVRSLPTSWLKRASRRRS